MNLNLKSWKKNKYGHPLNSYGTMTVCIFIVEQYKIIKIEYNNKQLYKQVFDK